MIDPRIVGPGEAYQFLLMMRLTEKCLCEDPHKRLSMDEVSNAMDFASVMCIATYYVIMCRKCVLW